MSSRVACRIINVVTTEDPASKTRAAELDRGARGVRTLDIIGAAAERRRKQEGRAMNLLDSKTWTGRLFLDGWRAGSGGERDVVEPATGEKLGRVGMAAPADVRRAAERAGEAQRAWAAASY